MPCFGRFDAQMRMLTACEISMHKVCATKLFFTDGKNLWLAREVPSWPTQRLLKRGPIKPGAGVFFSIGGDMLMPRDVVRWVVLCNGGAQATQAFVLRAFEGFAFQAFELDAN